MHDRAAQRNRIEPAAAPPPPGNGAEFVADAGQILARVIEQFGRKGTRTDTRGVGLDDAQHLMQPPRSNTGTGRRAARGGCRGGHVRIGSKIHIEHRSLCAFEQHIAPIHAQLLENARDIGHQWLQAFA